MPFASRNATLFIAAIAVLCSIAASFAITDAIPNYHNREAETVDPKTAETEVGQSRAVNADGSVYQQTGATDVEGDFYFDDQDEDFSDPYEFVDAEPVFDESGAGDDLQNDQTQAVGEHASAKRIE